MTQFIAEEVPVLDGITLFIDGNSKITAGNGTYQEPKPNALSLPHISTCPGATDNCMSSCYVHGLKEKASDLYAKYAQNERVIHRILLTSTSAALAAKALGTWIAENCEDGFRWHVSGDVMNNRYAQWIVEVAGFSPKVRHWLYTRSLSLVPILRQAENLAVNISADQDNVEEALKVARETGARVCWLTPEDGSIPEGIGEGDVVFPDYHLRGRSLDVPTSHPWWQSLPQAQKKLVCPPDFFGQSENHRCGPCSKCMHPV